MSGALALAAGLGAGAGAAACPCLLANSTSAAALGLACCHRLSAAGDSIIIVLARAAKADLNDWRKYFGGDQQSAPLAVIGNNAENLAWRLMKVGALAAVLR